MATKAEKKRKASRLIQDALPAIPFPVRRLPTPLRILPAAQALAQLLVETDPLGIITDDPVPVPGEISRLRSELQQQPMELSPASVKKIINDTDIKMNGSNTIETEEGEMEIRMIVQPAEPLSGREVIRRSGQFDRQNLLPRMDSKPKRNGRKRTKTDKNMSKALRLANEKFRTKSGKLRKGATQAQIMRYAHKLRRRMSK